MCLLETKIASKNSFEKLLWKIALKNGSPKMSALMGDFLLFSNFMNWNSFQLGNGRVTYILKGQRILIRISVINIRNSQYSTRSRKLISNETNIKKCSLHLFIYWRRRDNTILRYESENEKIYEIIMSPWLWLFNLKLTHSFILLKMSNSNEIFLYFDKITLECKCRKMWFVKVFIHYMYLPLFFFLKSFDSALLLYSIYV